jgi:hypothetical protein
MFSTIPFFIRGPVPAAGDPDATAYLAAVVAAGGTVTPTIETAVDTLFTDLKSYGVYSKLAAFYPIVGATQAAHAVEGKNPGGAQNLTFSGSWTHTNKGMKPTTLSTSNYADTQYLPTSLNPNSNHMFGYFNQSGGANGYDGAGTSPYFLLGHSAFEFFSSAAIVSAAGNLTTYGAILGTRTSSSVTKILGSLDGSAFIQRSNVRATPPTTYPSSSITLGKANPAGFPNADRYAFWSVGDGLTDAEGLDYYNAVLAFQTSLERNTNL